MELRNRVRTFEVSCRCDDCGGAMLPTGVVLDSNPPQFPHRCELCGIQRVFDVQYPHLEHVVR